MSTDTSEQGLERLICTAPAWCPCEPPTTGSVGEPPSGYGGAVFDSIIVVTDRRILDKQISGTIRQYAQIKATIGHAERSGDLRRFVEGHEHAIRLKAEIMVDHFHNKVLAQSKLGGEARAMVVTNGIARAPVFPRHPRLPARTQKPLPGHRGVFGRAQLRRRERERVFTRWKNRNMIFR